MMKRRANSIVARRVDCFDHKNPLKLVLRRSHRYELMRTTDEQQSLRLFAANKSIARRRHVRRPVKTVKNAR